MKIKTLTLTDFRAFPGPDPQPFKLDGKNLLVYGENGAGKSSLFYALRDFFAFKPTKALTDHKNVFSGQAEADCQVAVEFTDGTAAVEWNSTRHPGSRLVTRGDPRVKEAALRRACLDYRSVLDTNYLHGDKEINLFHIAVNQLVHDFPVTVTGGVIKTVGALWQEALNAKPSTHYSTSFVRVNEACVVFNAGFNQALTSLHPKLIELLRELLGNDVVVSQFRFPGITYQSAHFTRDRKFSGQEVSIDITFRGHHPDRPQHFLNEARLSALGLAIYLAGRLAFIPATPSPALKLLVLDDVLIGLDHSNRLPVLDLLERHFSEWQIILLTHDRLWYETVKIRAEVLDGWRAVEVYENQDSAANYAPHVEPVGSNVVKEYLIRASKHLVTNDLRAASVYARSAFEMLLKKFCHNKGIPIPFSLEPHKHDTKVYYSALKHWTEYHQAGAAFLGLMNLLELYRGTVLNPGSHSTPTTLNSAEIKAAIRALTFVSEVPNYGKNSLEIIEKLLSKTPLSADELPLLAGYLRAAFMQRLRKFVQAKSSPLPFTMKPEGIPALDLWQAVRPTLIVENPTLVANIETHRALYIDMLTRPVVMGIGKPFLQAAFQAIKPWF